MYTLFNLLPSPFSCCFLLRESGCAIIGMLRRLSRIAAQRSEQTTRSQNEDDNANREDPWCSCGQPQSDRFMIECDHKGEKCYHWYHGDCVGITPTEGRRLESQGETFICPFCATVPSLPPFTSANAPDFTWGSSVGSIFCEQIHKAYESIVHWRHNRGVRHSVKSRTPSVKSLKSNFEIVKSTHKREIASWY